jgi:hypothetical protein
MGKRVIFTLVKNWFKVLLYNKKYGCAEIFIVRRIFNFEVYVYKMKTKLLRHLRNAYITKSTTSLEHKGSGESESRSTGQ